MWAQGGGEGDGELVDFSRVGVDAEDDVVEDALEWFRELLSLVCAWRQFTYLTPRRTILANLQIAGTG